MTWKNMRPVDRVLRFIGAIIVLALVLLGVLKGTWATVLGIFAVVNIFGSLTGFCPGYVPFQLLKKHCCKPEQTWK